MKTIKKPELLMPASGLDVLKTVVMFGADAVYIGGEAFGLRAAAKNFTRKDMEEGIAFAHDHGAKVYVTANIYAHNRDLDPAREYFKELSQVRPDAIIVSDPGMFSLAREYCPGIDLHISTQANTTNYETCRFWHSLGASRIVTARELSMKEIRELRENIPEDLEIETFVHGAMCISYSGRCLLSAYFTGRDANQGACTHPCRWEYGVQDEGQSSGDAQFSCECHPSQELQISGDQQNTRELHLSVEEKSRPGEYMDLIENERGTYIFNSKDLSMIGHIPELIDAGIDSFKVEGRMKTALYGATIAGAYRAAIDDYLEDPDRYRANLPYYIEEVQRCTHRRYGTGFFFGKPGDEAQIYDESVYINDYVYLGTVEELAGDEFIITQKNKFSVNDDIEILKPGRRAVKARVISIKNDRKEPMESCPHASQKLYIRLSEPVSIYDILRRNKNV